ncbi:biopolymer transporter ExbD [Candidatus Sororendozoicomonas aggregata]|uniref:ExbD/TolR family protein n=1 Tax=Candidatus Sororendozoicomonas aggregata TaxID=3073239 RepID=UPI002ED34EB3
MKFRRQASQDDVSVNLTPLIDVVFLLLIFFMVSTTFKDKAELVINLPQSSAAVQTQKNQPVEVTISQSGNYAVNGTSLANGRLETVKAALSEASGGDSKKPLVITADADATYQAVVTAMDAAGQLGFVNLSMTTKRAASRE